MNHTFQSKSFGLMLGMFLAFSASLVLTPYANAQTAPVPSLTSSATVSNVPTDASQGDLVKCNTSPAVYYYGEDGKRYVFQNSNSYFSWYDDFSQVRTIACSDLATLPIGGIVPYQAGTRLIKTQLDPHVYAVLPNGRLRPVKSEEQAQKLYGSDWGTRGDDINEAFFPQYTVEAELEDSELPEGYVFGDENNNTFQVDTQGDAVQIDSEIQHEDQHRWAEYKTSVSALDSTLRDSLNIHREDDDDFETHAPEVNRLRTKIEIHQNEHATERTFKVGEHSLDYISKAEENLNRAKVGLGVTNASQTSYAQAENLVTEAENALRSARDEFYNGNFGLAKDLAQQSRRASRNALQAMRISEGTDEYDDLNENDTADDSGTNSSDSNSINEDNDSSWSNEVNDSNSESDNSNLNEVQDDNNENSFEDNTEHNEGDLN